MHRLAGIWSFDPSGPLDWRIDIYLKKDPQRDVDALLYIVAAYARLSAETGDRVGTIPPPEWWMELYNKVGTAAIFDLPQLLNEKERAQYEKTYSDAFVCGWRGAPLLHPLPP